MRLPADIAERCKAWPFQEAGAIIKRLAKAEDANKTVLFQTGYGPSGLPHIGTFGEVARTLMVKHAFETLTGREARLICFSDDMDGLRKVPDGLPNPDMLSEHLGQPLSAIPDPFGTHESFAAHNNARLYSFLDQFEFNYEFYSATECYRSGKFDRTLRKMLATYDDIMNIILPTLGGERQATYSPFLPVCQRTGKVLQVPMVNRDTAAGTVTYLDPENGDEVVTPITGGRIKCQWKADWAMRWTALGVDYEMAGKDLIDSVHLSGRICKAIGGNAPAGFSYELFLDENGEKISKSRGNGLTMDEWLKYASPQSLSLFMYQKPKTAKRLHFDVIPKNVDEYLAFLGKYPGQELGDRLNNPVWHIHKGEPPAVDVPLSFSLLLNLVSASNSEEKEVLWGFIRRYAEGVTPESHPQLDDMVGYAIAYFHDFVKPHKSYRKPDKVEEMAMKALYERLAEVSEDISAADLQNIVYEVGRQHEFDNLRDWFRALYEVLLGQSQGPRFGSFMELYGIEETRQMIASAIDL
jgi:lysyl-tRNA synthetase class 1